MQTGQAAPQLASFGAHAQRQCPDPDFELLLCNFVRQSDPNLAFTSVYISDNLASSLHADTLNSRSSSNLCISIGAFAQGQLWVQSASGSVPCPDASCPQSGILMPVADHPCRFDPHAPHCTMPWQGERVVCVAHSVDVTNAQARDLCRPVCLELFCGAAGLSAALANTGNHTIAVDLPQCEHRSRHARVAMHLSSEAHQCLVLSFIQDCPQLAHIHMGLPCKNCSRAKLYEFALRVVSAASLKGCTISIENPNRSWLWTVLATLARPVPQWRNALRSLRKTCFHLCMYGSSRRKSTALLATPGLFDHFLECDGSHQHASWGVLETPRRAKV